MKTDDLKEFLTSLSETLDEQTMMFFKGVIDNSEIKEFDGPEEFFYAILYPWEKFIKGYLRSSLTSDQDVEFIFFNWNYLDRHLCEVFSKYEGQACSADKSRTIIYALVEFYSLGKPISFDYSGEYTYHLPDDILKEHEDIIMFYEAMRDLFIGSPYNYIKMLHKIARNS